MRESRQIGAMKISMPIPQLRWWRLRLSILHIDHGFKHLCFHGYQLLKSRQKGGGELATLLFSMLLFSALVLRFLVLAI
jgi:hypothetical protein